MDTRKAAKDAWKGGKGEELTTALGEHHHDGAGEEECEEGEAVESHGGACKESPVDSFGRNRAGRNSSRVARRKQSWTTGQSGESERDAEEGLGRASPGFYTQHSFQDGISRLQRARQTWSEGGGRTRSLPFQQLTNTSIQSFSYQCICTYKSRITVSTGKEKSPSDSVEVEHVRGPRVETAVQVLVVEVLLALVVKPRPHARLRVPRVGPVVASIETAPMILNPPTSL